MQAGESSSENTSQNTLISRLISPLVPNISYSSNSLSIRTPMAFEKQEIMKICILEKNRKTIKSKPFFPLSANYLNLHTRLYYTLN